MRLTGTVAICAFLLIGAAPAGAATVTVDFESATPGALNASTASAQGVRFGEWFQTRTVSPNWGVITEGPTSQAASGTRLAIDDYRRGQGEFPCGNPGRSAPAIFGRLTSLASGLSVKIGSGDRGKSAGLAMLRGFDVNGAVVLTDTATDVTLHSAGTLLEGTANGAIIAYFEVKLPDSDGATECSDLLLDDLTITKPDVELPGISLQYVGPDPDPNPFLKDPAVVGLRPDVTESGRIVVTKFGNAGNVQLAVQSEPATVDATVGPATSGNSFPVTLKASPKAANERVEVSVRGTASGGQQPIVADLRIPVRTARDFVLDAPATVVAQQGCAAQVPIALATPNTITFPGPGDDGLMTVQAPNRPPVTAKTSAGSIAASEGGFTLTTPPVGAGGITVQVTGENGAADPHVASIQLTADAAKATIATVKPNMGRTPQLLKPGTEVTITGAGFCPGMQVSFGAPGAVSAATVAPDGKSMTVRVPRLAVSGAVGIAGTAIEWQPVAGKTGVFVVDSFRNVNAYPFENFYLADLEFADTVRLYGYDATHYELTDDTINGVCEVFTLGFGECDAEVAPAEWPALIHHAVVDAALSGDPGDAHCFGLSVTSRQFLSAKSSLKDYNPQAKRVFELDGPGKRQSKLRRYYRAQHGGQMSAEFINTFLGYYLNAEINDTSEVVDELKSFMKNGIAPVIAMNDGGSGHVVVAYDIEPAKTKGDFYVHTWDSNVPYVSKEAAEADTHESRLKRSRIVLKKDNLWRYDDLDYGPGEYDGSNHRLIIFDGGALKKQPTLPTSISGLYHVVFGASADTEKAKGRDAVPYTLFDAASSSGTIFTKGSAPVVRKITPDSGGDGYMSYTAGAGMSAALEATNATPGQTDTLTMEPDDASIRLATKAKLRKFSLALSSTRGTDRGLILRGETGAGAVSVEMEGKAAVVRASAPVKLTPVLVGQVKAGTAIHRLDPIKLADGARLEIEPKKWSKVLGALKIRVRGSGPNMTRTAPAVR